MLLQRPECRVAGGRESQTPMDSFTRGLLVGFLSSLVLGAVATALVLRRLRIVRQKTARSIRRIRALQRRRIDRLQATIAGVQRLAEVGTLTGGLAHEIKNPLSTVQLNLQLLAEDLDPSNPVYSRLTNRLNIVQREASRLRDILDDFLRYAGKIELARKRVDVNALLEELMDFFSPQAQLQRVQIRLKREPEPLFASIDPRLIKQAVLNLMLNAVQAMPSGGELILAASIEKQNVNIDVIDTGGGIPAEAVQKIFQAYYSTKKGGSGLGLAMTKRIIEEHGGKISVMSEQGKGSIFRISLPREAPAKTGN
jgi:signal transduction histidine kinase